MAGQVIATGIVVIGRDVGDRLAASLASLPPELPAVYVDSGSRDDSVAIAGAHRVDVIALGPDRPFSAARGRNAGWRALPAACTAVQFLDGDSVLAAGWIEAGGAALSADPALAAVCGDLSERAPDASVYNALCAHEWHLPAGRIDACGGNALFRRAALVQADGFAEDMVAGEEPELCRRLTGLGWTVARLAVPMAAHDAAMTRFGQWWRRSVRSGFGFADLVRRDHAGTDRANRRRLASATVWAAAVPVGVAAALVLAGPLALALLLVYPLQAGRIAWRARDAVPSPRIALAVGIFTMLGKFAQLAGIAKFALRHRQAGR